jgi:putative spermidine/putrescine transport system ATP-binding protein
MKGAKVELQGIAKSYGRLEVLAPLDLVIESGEFFALLGPSGSGKSTLLGTIAGFVPATSGRVFVNGADITSVPPHRRNLGMVFQNYSLFPFMSVFRNIAFPLEMRGMPKKKIAEHVGRILDMVRLSHVADRSPSQLSGGQQQRVALARAAVYDPPLLLMDEPLGALDKNLREDLQEEIRQFHKQIGTTIIYVTHDQHEAAAMADRIAILKDGRLEQLGAPRDLYNNPRNAFVAGFLGEANLFDMVAVQGRDNSHGEVDTEQGLRLIARLSNEADRGVACVRPESIQINPSGESSLPNRFNATVVDVVHAAGSIRYRLRLNERCVVTVRHPNERCAATYSAGETVICAWDSMDTILIPKE